MVEMAAHSCCTRWLTQRFIERIVWFSKNDDCHSIFIFQFTTFPFVLYFPSIFTCPHTIYAAQLMRLWMLSKCKCQFHRHSSTSMVMHRFWHLLFCPKKLFIKSNFITPRTVNISHKQLAETIFQHSNSIQFVAFVSICGVKMVRRHRRIEFFIPICS